METAVRLYIETRTPIEQKRLKTFLSFDMFGDELGVEATPRMRQAYVELNDSLFGGDLLFGQAWSTTTDLESIPDVLDFRGIDNQFGSLQPQLRWTKNLTNNMRVMLALETPGNHIIEGADTLTQLPDTVVAATWDYADFNLMASLLVADLRASFNDGPTKSTIGFGGSISGKVKLPHGKYKNEFLFSLVYGRGIGSHYENRQPDAVFNTTTSNLETIPIYGATLGYVHGWDAHMTSTITYCCIEKFDNDSQAPTSVQGTEYSSGNLVWDMNKYWIVGIEGIWGKRKDKDDARGTVFRTQFTSRLSF